MPTPTLDLSSIEDVNALRQVLYQMCADGRAAWIRLGGLSAEAHRDHRGLLGQLARFGLGAEPREASPEIAVLDWSTVRRCTADGLALFGVIVHELASRGVRVIVCSPSDGDLSGVLQHGGIQDAIDAAHWITCETGYSRRIDVLGPAAFFGCTGDHRAAKAFTHRLYQTLREVGVDGVRAGLLVAVVVDLVQNVLSHSGAQHASAIALLHRRKRPPEIEIGIADGGSGVVAGVLAQERHAWLMPFTDTVVASAAFTRGLSGRADGHGGGVLSGLIRGLIDNCGATVIVRTDSAHVALSPRHDRSTPIRLDYGWGTQTLIRMRTKA